MKGVNSKHVCTYCHKTIDKRPIPVPGSDPVQYAHQACISKENLRRRFMGKPPIHLEVCRRG
jgi:hypothetical protein